MEDARAACPEIGRVERTGVERRPVALPLPDERRDPPGIASDKHGQHTLGREPGIDTAVAAPNGNQGLDSSKEIQSDAGNLQQILVTEEGAVTRTNGQPPAR